MTMSCWCEHCNEEIETDELDCCPVCGAYYPDDEEV